MSNFMVKGFKKLNLIKKNLEKIKKWNVYLRVYFYDNILLTWITVQ